MSLRLPWPMWNRVSRMEKISIIFIDTCLWDIRWYFNTSLHIQPLDTVIQCCLLKKVKLQKKQLQKSYLILNMCIILCCIIFITSLGWRWYTQATYSMWWLVQNSWHIHHLRHLPSCAMGKFEMFFTGDLKTFHLSLSVIQHSTHYFPTQLNFCIAHITVLSPWLLPVPPRFCFPVIAVFGLYVWVRARSDCISIPGLSHST